MANFRFGARKIQGKPVSSCVTEHQETQDNGVMLKATNTSWKELRAPTDQT